MAEQLGSEKTDVYVLSLSFDRTGVHPSDLLLGHFGLASRDADGNWRNAVDANFGGGKRFVLGPWKPGFKLGTYGIDLRTHTAWAVINHAGDFAVSQDF